MGKPSRDKGARGQREAANLLRERGFSVMESKPGSDDCDFLAVHDERGVFAVEVKYCECITLSKFRKQAREQAAKRKLKWMLLVRLPGYPHTFLVESADHEPCVWRGNR